MYSSGYDFKGKGVTYTQFVIDRDLNSWKLNFSWVPFGQRASWYFFIGIKSGLLSDLKYDKRREPDRNFLLIWKKRLFFTKDAPEPIGPYNQAVKIGKTLYVSGQIPLIPRKNGVGQRWFRKRDYSSNRKT